jgi:uncharacterized OsmC-like protein
MNKYSIKASLTQGFPAEAQVNQSLVSFDASSGRDPILPNPAELLLTSLAACLLKNIQRYSEILRIPYRKASITVTGLRSDTPPTMQKITYLLEVDTDASDQKIKNWHKNILKFGTITNTLSQACAIEGQMIKILDS